jgi:hypothetical protein
VGVRNMLGLRVQYLASTRVLEQTLDEHEHAPTVEHKEEHGLQHRKEDLQQKILNDGIGASLATVDQIVRGEDPDQVDYEHSLTRSSSHLQNQARLQTAPPMPAPTLALIPIAMSPVLIP